MTIPFSIQMPSINTSANIAMSDWNGAGVQGNETSVSQFLSAVLQFGAGSDIDTQSIIFDDLNGLVVYKLDDDSAKVSVSIGQDDKNTIQALELVSDREGGGIGWDVSDINIEHPAIYGIILSATLSDSVDGHYIGADGAEVPRISFAKNFVVDKFASNFDDFYSDADLNKCSLGEIEYRRITEYDVNSRHMNVYVNGIDGIEKTQEGNVIKICVPLFCGHQLSGTTVHHSRSFYNPNSFIGDDIWYVPAVSGRHLATVGSAYDVPRNELGVSINGELIVSELKNDFASGKTYVLEQREFGDVMGDSDWFIAEVDDIFSPMLNAFSATVTIGSLVDPEATVSASVSASSFAPCVLTIGSARFISGSDGEFKDSFGRTVAKLVPRDEEFEISVNQLRAEYWIIVSQNDAAPIYPFVDLKVSKDVRTTDGDEFSNGTIKLYVPKSVQGEVSRSERQSFQRIEGTDDGECTDVSALFRFSCAPFGSVSCASVTSISTSGNLSSPDEITVNSSAETMSPWLFINSDNELVASSKMAGRRLYIVTDDGKVIDSYVSDNTEQMTLRVDNLPPSEMRKNGDLNSSETYSCAKVMSMSTVSTTSCHWIIVVAGEFQDGLIKSPSIALADD